MGIAMNNDTEQGFDNSSASFSSTRYASLFVVAGCHQLRGWEREYVAVVLRTWYNITTV